jgi:hypothetical protein
MTFTSDIPISGDTLGSTRDRIRTNFQQIALVEAVNHVPFNALGQGKHKFLQMPEQPGTIGQVGVPLPPTTLANEAGFYSKIGANPAEANLVFRGENNGFEYQLTRADQTNNATFGTSTGWTFLPGGLILQYGTMTTTGNTTVVVFPVPLTVPLYSLTATIVQSSTENISWGVDARTLIGFEFKRSGSAGNRPFSWMVIGK